jgi:hypothetical protein
MEKFARGKCCLEGNILSLHMCEMCLRDDLGRGMFSSDLRHREGGCTCLEYAMEQPCPCGLPESWRDNFSGTRAFGPMVSLSWARRGRGSWAKNRARQLGLDWPPPKKKAKKTVCQAGCAEAEVERNAKRHAKRKLRKRKLLDLGADMRQKGHDIYANNEAYTERLHIRLQEVEAMVPPHLLVDYENINGVRVEGFWLRPTNFVSSPQGEVEFYTTAWRRAEDEEPAARRRGGEEEEEEEKEEVVVMVVVEEEEPAARMMDERVADSGTDTTLELDVLDRL